MTPLDRPVWSSLTTSHLELSDGDHLARRYARDVNQFASPRDDEPHALERLSSLIKPRERVFILQAKPFTTPAALRLVDQKLGVQMLDSGTQLPVDDHGDIAALEDKDAAEMLTLAERTKPGPFVARTHVMGDYFGVRVDGRLIAMAGERMRFPGYTEISGVCTHPDFRGCGYGRRLLSHVMTSIRARGETPFLHAWKSNASAIRLYESIGFRLRCDVHVSVLTKQDNKSMALNC